MQKRFAFALALSCLATLAPTAMAGTRSYTQQADEVPVPISAQIMRDLRVHSVPPRYPEAERSQRLPGDATLRVVLAKDGTIESVTPVFSTSEAFAAAAVESVRQWTFKGYIVNGQAVRVEGEVQVHFRIGR